MTLALPLEDVCEDTASGQAETGPHRRCIVSGRVEPKTSMIRFVAGPGGEVIPDLASKLPGRGLWLLASRDMIHTACTRNAFSRAAKVPLRTPPGIADRVERLLVSRCIEILGLARRAGRAVGGFQKVSSRIAGGDAGVLLQARDAAGDGRNKMRALARAQDPCVPVVECLDARELGQAFGGRPFVHVVVDRGALARRICQETARLGGVRGTPVKAGETP